MWVHVAQHRGTPTHNMALVFGARPKGPGGPVGAHEVPEAGPNGSFLSLHAWRIGPAYGRIWPHMAAYGRKWPHMAHMNAYGPYGRIWPHMAAHGRTWPHMAAYSRIWPTPHMAAYGPYGRIWPHMAAYGRIWAHMGAYGRTWPHKTLPREAPIGPETGKLSQSDERVAIAFQT